MNDTVISFHKDIVSDTIDDIDLLNGFIVFYVLNNYTLSDLQKTLVDVFSMNLVKSYIIIGRLRFLLNSM